MNKYFLAGCAAAALVIGSGVANAQDFKVTISGDAKFQAMFVVGQDKNNNSRSVDFRNRFRFNVNPEATGLDGALTYGAHTKLKSEDGNVTQEDTKVYLSGAFGKVQLGNMGGFIDGNNTNRPADWQSEDGIPSGMASKSQDDAWAQGVGRGRLWSDQFQALNNDGTKIRYDSPFISGFKFGFTYNPNASSNTWDVSRVETTTRQDVWEVGLFFDSTDKSIADRFAGAKVKAAFGYMAGSNKSTIQPTGLTASAAEDLSAYYFGAQVGYAGFTVGGNYTSYGKSDIAVFDASKTSRFGWGVGAQYETGPWVFGLGYTFAQKDGTDYSTAASYAATTNAKQTAKIFSAGVKYTVAKGLAVSLDYGHVNAKNTNAWTDTAGRAYTSASDTANIITLTTAIDF